MSMQELVLWPVAMFLAILGALAIPFFSRSDWKVTAGLLALLVVGVAVATIGAAAADLPVAVWILLGLGLVASLLEAIPEASGLSAPVPFAVLAAGVMVWSLRRRWRDLRPVSPSWVDPAEPEEPGPLPAGPVPGYLAGMSDLPPVRGSLTPGRPLNDLTWLRVGGPAEWLFQPADEDDLAGFLRDLDPSIPVFPMGVGSNLIVRDGGIRGVVVRLGRGFNAILCGYGMVTAGAAALDAHVARKAAEAGLDRTFLRTIPGSIGGAVRMNAGCYGQYVADRLVSVRVVTRAGEALTLPAAELNLRYRQSDLPPGAVITAATFRAAAGDPAALDQRMAEQVAKRDASQPTRDRSAGSTFRNPLGRSSTGRADDTHELKAWKVIDDAGMRGATRGGAQMSPMHANFLINTGTATAADLEGLGEEVRKRVFQHSGITLEWEIMRVGEPAP